MENVNDVLPDICNRLETTQILPYLKCLTKADKEKIERDYHIHGPQLANQTLIYRLGNRDPAENLKQFLHGLRETGYKDIADKILPQPPHRQSSEIHHRTIDRSTSCDRETQSLNDLDNSPISLENNAAVNNSIPNISEPSKEEKKINAREFTLKINENGKDKEVKITDNPPNQESEDPIPDTPLSINIFNYNTTINDSNGIQVGNSGNNEQYIGLNKDLDDTDNEDVEEYNIVRKSVSHDDETVLKNVEEVDDSNADDNETIPKGIVQHDSNDLVQEHCIIDSTQSASIRETKNSKMKNKSNTASTPNDKNIDHITIDENNENIPIKSIQPTSEVSVDLLTMRNAPQIHSLNLNERNLNPEYISRSQNNQDQPEDQNQQQIETASTSSSMSTIEFPTNITDCHDLTFAEQESCESEYSVAPEQDISAVVEPTSHESAENIDSTSSNEHLESDECSSLSAASHSVDSAQEEDTSEQKPEASTGTFFSNVRNYIHELFE